MSDLTKIPAPDEYGVRHPHKTVPLQVWVDVDEGIKPVVAYLNTVPGIRTLASCQGTLGEDGPEPYAPYVYVTWESESALRLLRERFSVNVLGESFGTVHPKEGMDYSTPDAAIRKPSRVEGGPTKLSVDELLWELAISKNQEHVPLVGEIRRRLEDGVYWKARCQQEERLHNGPKLTSTVSAAENLPTPLERAKFPSHLPIEAAETRTQQIVVIREVIRKWQHEDDKTPTWMLPELIADALIAASKGKK